MSNQLINRNSDLKKLRDEGYEIEVKSGYLLIRHVPYVTSEKRPALGMLVTSLGDLAGDDTVKPQDHTMYFSGELPCNKNGDPIVQIINNSEKKTLAEGIEVDHYFSAMPEGGKYDDYYDKVTTYLNIIVPHAQRLDNTMNAKTFKVIEPDDPEEVFCYLDTNSSRADIEIISSKLKNLKIGIIGLGGTGSYVLDFVAKTPVREIHLFDGDVFLSHNAFRCPGAASIDALREQPEKVDYLRRTYSNMHKHIVSHKYKIDSSNCDELSTLDFVFICIDGGSAKEMVFRKLIEMSIPLIDVGIGIEVTDNALGGSARVTIATAANHERIDKSVSFLDNTINDYDRNIQIAELNALNACLAVIKWKKHFGVYHEQSNEQNAVYDVNINKIMHK